MIDKLMHDSVWKVVSNLRECEGILRNESSIIREEDISVIALELDRIRAALFYAKYGIPNDNTLAKNSGHQPSCDGNCIATRGSKNES